MTINRMFLAGILLAVFAVSFAAESNKSVRDLYDELVRLQKDWTLEDIKKQQRGECSTIDAGNMQRILENAKITGFNKKYKYLLTTSSSQFMSDSHSKERREKEGYMPSFFYNYQNLRIIACLQQMYGQGQPFVYSNSNNPEKESDKISPAPGQMSPYYAVLGTYIAPGNQQRIITQYGFFNGLIDTIMHFKNDTQFSGDQWLILNVDSIKKALTEAITVSKFYNYVRQITESLGKGHAFTPENLEKKVIPAMEKYLFIK